MTRESKESPLSRWSRRKAEAQQVEEALQEEVKPALDAETAFPAEIEEPPVLTDADMPDLDTLDENSDYSGFMSKGVSEELRNLALRKLFRSSVFNIRDGLDEYDEDYTTFEKLGDIVTCDMKHHIEKEQQRLREKLAEQGEPAANDSAVIEDEIEDDIDDDIEDDITEEIEDAAAPKRVAGASSATTDEPDNNNEQ